MKIGTFRPKQQEVQAIQFVYSAEGIALLKEFCNNRNVATSKDRSPNSVGVALISGTGIRINEGDYITKCGNEYAAYTSPEFNKMFEEFSFRGGDNPYILLSSKTRFYFKEPEKHIFLIDDIAQALSQINRYTGHTPATYTVAQHSVLASYLVPQEFAFDTLMHDASEAYLGDVSSPLKSLLPEYKKIEAATEEAIAKQFGLIYPMPREVRIADMRMLTTEFIDVVGTTPPAVCDAYQRMDNKIELWDHATSKREFMRRYKELTMCRTTRSS